VAWPLYAAEYEITATYNDLTHQIEGKEIITFVHEGVSPLSQIRLILYPNIYLAQDPTREKTDYQKIYPVRFNPGSLSIQSVSDLGGAPLTHRVETVDNKKILLSVALPLPVAPQQRFSFQVDFTTQIPEKYGVFGHAHGQVTLQGGWHPYLPQWSNGAWGTSLPAQKDHFRVWLTLGNDLKLQASLPPVLSHQAPFYSTYRMEGVLPFLGLSIGREAEVMEQHFGPVHVVYHYPPPNAVEAKLSVQLVEEIVRFLQLHVGPLGPLSLRMTSAFLSDTLTARGAEMLYIHTRLFKVIPALRHYHEAALARAILEALLQTYLPHEESWVIEGLAPIFAEEFMQLRYQKRADLTRWLRPVSFIPLADEILYSKGLPLRGIYFDEPVVPMFNEDIRSFDHSRSDGAAIFLKLKNLLGEEGLEQALSNYRNPLGQKRFRDTLSHVSGRALDTFLEAWLGDNLSVDFYIAEIKKHRTKTYETTITLGKDVENTEPVEVEVWDRQGQKYLMRWEGIGKTHTEVLRTNAKIKSVEIDPQHRIRETDRSNNRTPRRWKILLNRLGLSGYNLNTSVVGIKMGLLFAPVYSERDRVVLDFSRNEIGYAGRLEYAHTFHNQHTLTTGLLYERPRVEVGMPSADPAGVLRIGYAFSYPDTPLYFPRLLKLLQRFAGDSPTLRVAWRYDQQVTPRTGEKDHRVTAELDLRKSVLWAYDHEAAFRFRLGTSWGNLFENSRFFLGGSEMMRGFRPLIFEGESLSLLSVEYRVPLGRRIPSYHLKGWAYTQGLQGVLFADAGHAAKWRDLLEFDDYQLDAGVGLRWRFDVFGFYPTLMRVDVAWPVDTQIKSERQPHYYISTGHTF